MKTFELSKRNMKNGRRKFKIVLCEVFHEDTIDEENRVGTKYNRNGISWIEPYVRAHLDTIPGMFLRAEFLDEERTELNGHGETGFDDGMPIFENAVDIGMFTKGYIEEVETEDGVKLYCIGEGEIDAACYNKFVKKLDKDISNGSPPYGSVEILKTDDNDAIVYKYGYVPEGRIPVEFQVSGYALLGVQPADDAAYIVELNNENKEDVTTMTEAEIKELVAQTVSEVSAHASEMNKCKEECEAKIGEANAAADEATANAEKLEKALEECRKELQEKYEEIDKLHEELGELREMLAKAKAKERVGELNEAIKEFAEEEKQYAQAEIDAFNNDPVNSEINSVVNKIWEGIGKKSKADAEKQAAIVAEQNAASAAEIEDIFSEVSAPVANTEDENIF